MILSHLILGFITSYIGYTPPSMLNITASKIYIENDKKVARQFVVGVSLIVLVQFFLAVLLTGFFEKFPKLIFWIQSVAIVVFSLLSVLFTYKGLSKPKHKTEKVIKNGFLFGMSLSSVNMFAVPFFAIAHSSFVMNGWAMPGFICTSIFGIGTVLGIIAVLSSYIFLAKKVKTKLIFYTQYFNLFIGIITGIVAVYFIVKLYF
ncbi:hypothetical protein V1T75_12670 [Tenacibaculum sp. FZY0031]|uniref:hypothetical protein n=1 Tax=unclassified Tenacibaculum TaxID=2635139 RepID=UPI002ECEED54|nr:hypothetical protein [Tenacibaculum sp. FZY0031]